MRLPEVPAVIVASIVLNALILACTVLVGRRLRVGWLLFVVSDVAWAAYGMSTGQPGFLLFSLVMIWPHIWNYRRWKGESGALAA